MDSENHHDKLLFAVDSINGNEARCENIENKERVLIPLAKLPANAKEGDIISYSKGHFIFERKKTEERKEKIDQLFNSLWD